MASQLQKTRTITDKLTVKGLLSNDGTKILYTDEDKSEKEISLDKCFELFAGKPINLSISVKSETDLVESEDDDADAECES